MFKCMYVLYRVYDDKFDDDVSHKNNKIPSMNFVL